jgi:tetratricopeptide (TPR) repeat protein
MHRLATWRLLAATILALALCARSSAETPLYEEDPYDQITLNAANRHAVLKIKPLELSDAEIPTRPKVNDKLVIRLVDRPDSSFEVAWRSIVKIERFGQLVLERANALAAEGELDEAYDHFQYLEQNRPNTPGLGKAMEDYLYAEASQAERRQRYDEAVATLRELYRRNPKRPGLDQALSVATDKLISRYAEASDYLSARTLLGALATELPDHPVVLRWQTRLKAEAAALLTQAQAAIAAGRLSEAAALSRRLIATWPQLPGARELAETTHGRYPRVVVGVVTPATDLMPGRLTDWAARRASRLVYRTLTEYAGPGSAGGEYICPVGKIAAESLGRRVFIQVRPDIRWAHGNASLTGLDVSRRLLALADPTDAAFRLDWADLLAAVSVHDIYGVEAELRHAHVRPEAMLQTILTPQIGPSASGQPPPNGPFQMPVSSAREAVFTANTQYFAAEAGQPKEIVERHYASVTQAIAAMKRGDIQVLDRLNPWNLAAAGAVKDLTVESYAIPVVHCLIPNLRKPLLADRTFRRALAYGIHRKMILDQMLDGRETPGCRLVSSPFPAGIGVDDPINYALDDSIEPRPYEPRLAIALASIALQSQAPTPKGQKKATKAPRLVLAYPPDEVAQGACASIKRQLGLLGIPIDLQAFDGPLPDRLPDQIDLLYAELGVWEPLVDAQRVLGEGGLAGGCSPHMSLALRQLNQASDWRQARNRLCKIHRLLHDETAIVPLWQLVEHFVYHNDLKGIAPRPVSLYQNVEQWRMTFQYPADR